MILQSILFNRNIWQKHDVIKWLKSHNYKFDLDTKPKHYRARQKSPNILKGKNVITKNISNGVSLIIAY